MTTVEFEDDPRFLIQVTHVHDDGDTYVGTMLFIKHRESGRWQQPFVGDPIILGDVLEKVKAELLEESD